MDPNHLDKIQELKYHPVGLGEANFSPSWMRDKSGDSISFKNKYYGEYTFHYWIWKNNLINTEDKWIGFCQYRKFWSEHKYENKNNYFNEFKNIVLDSITTNNENYESIIGEPFFVNQFRFSKFIKHNFKTMASNPALFFDEKKRNLKFHFDMMHGKGNLDRAIDLLDTNDQSSFRKFVNSEVSFNPHNMFICKNKKILNSYYNCIFPWLQKCENIFAFKNLKGYGLQRIYGFLAERFMSYWFQKNTNYKTMPIIFKDISDFNYKDL